MLKMLKYPNGQTKGEIDTEATLEQIKATQGLFFRNKANGARETYKVYKGFLIVSTKIKGEPISGGRFVIDDEVWGPDIEDRNAGEY